MSQHDLFRCDADGCDVQDVAQPEGFGMPPGWTTVQAPGKRLHLCPHHRSQESWFEHAREAHFRARAKALGSFQEPYQPLINAKIRAWDAVNPRPRWDAFKPTETSS